VQIHQQTLRLKISKGEKVEELTLDTNFIVSNYLWFEVFKFRRIFVELKIIITYSGFIIFIFFAHPNRKIDAQWRIVLVVAKKHTNLQEY